MLFNVFLLLCITKVYLAKRSSILNVQKSKVHVIYWKAYMHILHTIQKEFKSSLDWLTQWKLKVSGFWKTSKLVGFQCYSQLREFYLNIGPWFWRCIRMLTLLIRLPIIWNRFCDLEVMVELFGIMPLLEGLNELIKFSPNLDNVLYVILLLGWSCVKNIYCSYIDPMLTWVMCSRSTRKYEMGHQM